MNLSDVHIQKQMCYGESRLSAGFRQPACVDDSRGPAWPGGGETKGHGGERRAPHPDYAQIPPSSPTSCEVQQVH